MVFPGTTRRRRLWRERTSLALVRFPEQAWPQHQPLPCEIVNQIHPFLSNKIYTYIVLLSCLFWASLLVHYRSGYRYGGAGMKWCPYFPARKIALLLWDVISKKWEMQSLPILFRGICIRATVRYKAWRKNCDRFPTGRDRMLNCELDCLKEKTWHISLLQNIKGYNFQRGSFFHLVTLQESISRPKCFFRID